MCAVVAEGDNKPSRNIWKTSVSKMNVTAQQQEDNVSEGVVVIDRKECKPLLEDVHNLAEQSC